MRKLTSKSVPLDQMLLLTVDQAQIRYSCGRDSLNQAAEQCHAVVRFGRLKRYHRVRLDDFFTDATGCDNGKIDS